MGYKSESLPVGQFYIGKECSVQIICGVLYGAEGRQEVVLTRSALVAPICTNKQSIFGLDKGLIATDCETLLWAMTIYPIRQQTIT